MNNLRRIRAKEQAEAYIRQLRTIPRCEAIRVMEDLLGELYSLRDVYYCERDGNSCSSDQDN